MRAREPARSASARSRPRAEGRWQQPGKRAHRTLRNPRTPICLGLPERGRGVYRGLPIGELVADWQHLMRLPAALADSAIIKRQHAETGGMETAKDTGGAGLLGQPNPPATTTHAPLVPGQCPAAQSLLPLAKRNLRRMPRSVTVVAAPVIVRRSASHRGKRRRYAGPQSLLKSTRADTGSSPRKRALTAGSALSDAHGG